MLANTRFVSAKFELEVMHILAYLQIVYTTRFVKVLLTAHAYELLSEHATSNHSNINKLKVILTTRELTTKHG